MFNIFLNKFTLFGCVVFSSTSLFAQISVFAEQDAGNIIQGLVTSSEEAIISGEIASRVDFIVEELSEFTENSTLVKLNCKLFEAEKNIVKSNLEIARIQHKKNTELYARRALGKNDIDISEAEYVKAQSEYEITLINTQRCIISAPFNGIVSEVSANKFEYVQKHQQLLKVVNLGKLIVKFLLPSYLLDNISVGDEIDLNIEELNANFKGTIKSIDKLIDPVSQTIKVNALISNATKNLLPGMTAVVLL